VSLCVLWHLLIYVHIDVLTNTLIELYVYLHNKYLNNIYIVTCYRLCVTKSISIRASLVDPFKEGKTYNIIFLNCFGQKRCTKNIL
jgi:hypothetical protein